MNDKLNNNVTIIPPFKKFCMTIGELPTSYTESMTYYESLVWLCNYIGSTLIPAINNNGEAVTELQEKYIELKNYVDNYFENLDVQEEIDHKLDEMAEQGELAEIIAQYLEVASVLGFDTKSALKGAENVVSGSICKTLGDDNYETGDGNFYRIRDLEEGDVIDDDELVGLTNFPALVAEKIPDYNINQINNSLSLVEDEIDILNTEVINVKNYGAYGDGVHDDILAIQEAIDDNPHKTIFFPEGTYLISSYIKVYGDNDHLVNLKLDTNAIITSDNSLSQLILVGDWSTGGSYNRFDPINYLIVEGGILDCTNVTRGIFTEVPLTKINNVHFDNIVNYGLVVGRSGYSSDTKVSGCNFTGVNSSTSEICTAIKVDGSDNEFNHIRIDATKIGVDVNGGGNYFNDVHMTAVFLNDDHDYYDDTIAFDISSGSNFFNLCYADTYHIGFNITANAMNFFTNCFTYWYYSNSSTEAICFNITNNFPRATITSSSLTVPTTGTNYLIKLNDTYAVNNLNLNDSIRLINNTYSRNATLSDNDPAYEMSVNRETGRQLFWSGASLTADTYYYIGTIKTSDGLYSFDINANDQFMSHVVLKYKAGSAALKSKTVYCNDNSYTYTILVGDQYTDDTNNTYANMYIKCSNNIGSNVSILNVSRCGTNSIFTKTSNVSSVIPSTTIAELTIS